ncbi:MAG: redoxin domain-containing protein [Gemmatimonadaceae bacterium]|nr:redoxin domain-containing protein [Gemmatimonadaceae bacterium]
MRFSPQFAFARLALLALSGSLLASSTARAQQTAVPHSVSPEVGSVAPDFTIAAATRYGVIREPVHLSDYRGKTVVLAFFYQARTKG